MEITAVVKGAWDAFTTQIMVFLPNLIGAIIIFLMGLIVAKIVKIFFVKFLRLVRFDNVADKTGIREFLQKGGIVKTSSELMGALVYWFIMILVLIATFNALGLPIVSNILNDIFLYIPNVVAAILVLSLGILVGTLFSAVVRTAASNAGMASAEGLGKAALYAVIFFSASVALIQLGIGEEIVEAVFVVSFGATALAFGLAFGLGGKEMAAGYLKKWLEAKKSTGKE